MPSQWDDTNQRLMLLAVIHLSAPATPKWDEVAALMGGTFTGNAIRCGCYISMSMFVLHNADEVSAVNNTTSYVRRPSSNSEKATALLLQRRLRPRLRVHREAPPRSARRRRNRARLLKATMRLGESGLRMTRSLPRTKGRLSNRMTSSRSPSTQLVQSTAADEEGEDGMLLGSFR
jgi:hypothetical protein